MPARYPGPDVRSGGAFNNLIDFKKSSLCFFFDFFVVPRPTVALRFYFLRTNFHNYSSSNLFLFLSFFDFHSFSLLFIRFHEF